MDIRELLSFPSLGTPTAPASGTPSIYASQEEWKAFRAQQAADVVAASRVTNAASDIRSLDNEIESNAVDAAMRELASQVPTPSYYAGGDSSSTSAQSVAAAGAGRGFTNPANVDPNAPQPDTVQGQGFIDAAFPEAFRKQPPKGVVNTNGGVERVNARTSEHGVTATRDAKGNVYMTNLNPDGSVNKGTGSPNSVLGDGRGSRQTAMVAPNTPLALNASLERLRTATPDEARGLMADINTSIAQAEAALTAEALKFGANKFGVAALEQQLIETQAADRNSYGWYPGIGDSPVTQKVRAQIDQANGAARQAAVEYLKTNVNQAALVSAKENAATAFKRIERLEGNAENLQANLTIRSMEKKALKEENAAEIASNLSTTAMNRIAILHPVSKGNAGEAGQWYEQRFKATKGEIDKVLNSTGAELVVHAMERNADALAILSAEEMKSDPTQNAETINMRLSRIRQLADSPDFAKKAATFKSIGLTGDAKKRVEQEYNQAIISGKTSLSADKKEAQKQRYEIALEMERAAQTEAVSENVGKVFSMDGPMGAAMRDAIKATNSTSLQNVLIAYVGSATKEEQINRIATFSKALDEAIRQKGSSIFGMPSFNKLKEEIINVNLQLRQESRFPRSSSPFTLG